ncbi:MAG: hemerythrin family protein [Verrucomicrobia bacterium]|nr:hemerythrin family protein [Verrucomicrobiota bacterium]
MKKIEWVDGLSVGIDLIDDQHKQWIEHYNHAVEAIQAKHEVAQIARSLDFLSDYTETHFATEEQVMTESHYPELEEHKAKHDALRKTLAAMTGEFIEDGATDLLAESVETFLGNWLIKHIKEVDMRFAAFTRAG